MTHAERPEWLKDDEVESTLTASTNQTSAVEITCRVRGKPAPTVTWSKDDDVIKMASSSDIYRVVDEREYRSDLHTWIVTSRLLLQGIKREVKMSSLFRAIKSARGRSSFSYSPQPHTSLHCKTTDTVLVHLHRVPIFIAPTRGEMARLSWPGLSKCYCTSCDVISRRRRRWTLQRPVSNKCCLERSRL